MPSPSRKRKSAKKPQVLQSGNVQLTPASMIKMKHTQWAWAGYVPMRELTILAGLGGVGKSTLLSELAAKLTRGKLEGDLEGKPTSVILASAEDSPEGTLKPRLVAAEAKMTRVYIETLSDDESAEGISLPDDIEDLTQLARRTKARVVMLDPLPSFLDGAVDDNNNTKTWQALKPIVQMARELDLAVIGLTHLNKRAENTSLTRVIGSVAYRNVPRSTLLLGAENDNPKKLHLIHTKCNFGTSPPLACHTEEELITVKGDLRPFRTSRFVFDGPSSATEQDLLSAPSGSDELGLKEEAALWLRAALEDGPVPSGEIYKRAKAEVGCSAETLRRAKKLVGVKAKQTPGGWVWELPTEGED